MKNVKACDMVTGLNCRCGYRGKDRLMKDKTGGKGSGEG